MILQKCYQHTGRRDAGVVERMRKILVAVRVLYTYTKSSRLSITEIRAAAHLKILLLSGRPCLHIAGLHLQIRQITRAALERAHRDIHAPEEVHRILPQPVIPHHRVLGLADHDHLLLLELMDTIYASLLEPVRTLLLSEAGRI